jgi:hypothetical protein
VQEIYRRSIQGIFVQTKVTTEGLKDFEERVTTGSVVPLIDQTETLWNSETVWTNRHLEAPWARSSSRFRLPDQL